MRATARGGTAAGFGFFLPGGSEHGGLSGRVAVEQVYREACAAGSGRRAAVASSTGTAGGDPRASCRRPRRPTRLTREQQVALDDLQALGALLTPDFTPEELRSTFRALARRYHPDRHPQAGQPAKAELSVLFRRLRAAYTVLSRP